MNITTLIAIVSPENEQRLKQVLRQEFNLHTANSVDEASFVLAQQIPSIVLVEQSLTCDIVRTEISKYQHTPILLTPAPSFEEGITALQQGFKGYGNLHSHKDRLIAAIKLVMTGETWLGAAITEGIKQYTNNKKTSDNAHLLKSLTEREYGVTTEVITGSSNRVIGEKLNISERTVKAHLSAIYEKLGVRNRTELIINYQNDF